MVKHGIRGGTVDGRALHSFSFSSVKNSWEGGVKQGGSLLELSKSRAHPEDDCVHLGETGTRASSSDSSLIQVTHSKMI